MSTTPAARIAQYIRRPVPAAYDAGYLGVELQNLQRSTPGASIRTLTMSQPQTVPDRTVLCDATAAALSYTLLSPTSVSPFALTIKKVDSSGHVVTVVGVVDGVTNPTLATQYKAMTILSDGMRWHLLSSV